MNRPSSRSLASALITTTLLALTACSDGTVDAPTTDAGTTAPADPAVLEESVAAILDEVSRTSGLAVDELTVLEDSPVAWASERLGCLHFDEPSEQVAVDGYRVVVIAGEVEFDYRLDAAGAYKLCGDPVNLNAGDDHDDDELDDETS